ncbi:MAG TPA: SURF1 family protein [Rheinheimera sp.]|uniref:SURF1 family protein n=1 Tax=Rheinheimera sp. TaxID=1869214 RepID=UPI002F93D0D7
MMRVKLAKQIFVFNPLWLVLTLTAFAILINLSWWQLNRAAEKAEYLQRLQQLQENGALEPAQLQTLDPASFDGAPLAGQATWLAPYIWLLDNQIVNGKTGYDVIVPVQAAGLTQPLLVNLGWLSGTSSRDVLPEPDIPATFTLDGLVRADVSGLMLLGQNVEDTGKWPMRIQQVDYTELSVLSDLTLYPALVYQLSGSLYTPHYKAVVLPPQKHRGYALQWFLLAVAVLGVALAASHQGKANYE